MTASRLWFATAPAMLLPFIASLFYFVLFSEHAFARVIYAGTKLFTLVWPLIAVWVVFRTTLPRIRATDPKHAAAIPLGAVWGLAVAGLALALMQTPLGAVVDQSAGAIRAKANELGFVSYYWFFALFLSLFHSLLEEYYWRWFVFGNLRRLVKPLTAHLVAAIAFAAHHVVIATQFFPLAWGVLFGALVGVGGLVFSGLYARQNTLVGAWTCHALIDLGIMTIGHQLLFD